MYEEGSSGKEGKRNTTAHGTVSSSIMLTVAIYCNLHDDIRSILP